VAQVGDYPIGLPETRLGIVPGAGGLQLLARAIPLSAATAFVLEGRAVAPAEALRMGLVHEVAPDAVARSIEWGHALARIPAEATRQVLAMARALAGGEGLAAGLNHAATAFLATLAPGSGARERMARFYSVGEDILA
jgi:enoyl-CoA hydratase